MKRIKFFAFILFLLCSVTNAFAAMAGVDAKCVVRATNKNTGQLQDYVATFGEFIEKLGDRLDVMQKCCESNPVICENCSYRNRNGDNIPRIAAKHKKFVAYKYFVEEQGCRVGNRRVVDIVKYDYSDTDLIIAIQNNDLELVKFILDKKYDYFKEPIVLAKIIISGNTIMGYPEFDRGVEKGILNLVDAIYFVKDRPNSDKIKQAVVAAYAEAKGLAEISVRKAEVRNFFANNKLALHNLPDNLQNAYNNFANNI